MNSLWAALEVPWRQYQSVRQRLKAFGVKDVYSQNDQNDNFYFHAPGGQVFRLIRKDKHNALGK